MKDTRPGPSLDERDFDAIEAAVMETERGRWFLGEFARRNRLGETRLLLDAVTRLEQNVSGPRSAEEIDLVRSELAAMGQAIATAAADLGGGEPGVVLDGFVGAVRTVESASADIHDAAERVGEVAWQLREAGGRAALCDELERAAAEISTACAFGGLTAGRARALVEALRAINERLDALPPAFRPVISAGSKTVAQRGEPALDRPPPVRNVSETSTRTAVSTPAVEDLAPIRRADAPASEPANRPPPRPNATLSMPVPSLAAISELDFRERLKLFT